MGVSTTCVLDCEVLVFFAGQHAIMNSYTFDLVNFLIADI